MKPILIILLTIYNGAYAFDDEDTDDDDVDETGIISAVVFLVLIAILFLLLIWAVGGCEEPFNKVEQTKRYPTKITRRVFDEKGKEIETREEYLV